MERNALKELIAWKNSRRRKPLIIKGARQVGKTWLMKEFAGTHYDDYVYISFDIDKEAGRIFDETKEPCLIIERISLIFDKIIHPEKTLIILDEIQECPNAIGSLKYFNENANEYHIVSAGSLLGTLLANPASYPVGKVNIMEIYPLTFDEFIAVFDGGMYRYYNAVHGEKDFVAAFHNRMLELHKHYLIIGGMPECVESWRNNHNPGELKEIQNEIIRLYESDFVKSSGKVNSGRVLQIFRSIIPQLAKENNEKFMYAAIAKSARARDFEEAVEWLVSSGIVHRVHNVSRAEYPIRSFEIINCFKLFLLDVGLAKQLADVTNKSIMLEDDFKFKGQLNENFVLQQLLPQMEYAPHYYAFGQEQELDFLVQNEEKIVPIEVKSSKNKKAASFKKYIEKYKPATAVRLNTNVYIRNGEITNIPLYLASKLFELI